MDRTGNLYVSDSFNNRVRVIFACRHHHQPLPAMPPSVFFRRWRSCDGRFPRQPGWHCCRFGRQLIYRGLLQFPRPQGLHHGCHHHRGRQWKRLDSPAMGARQQLPHSTTPEGRHRGFGPATCISRTTSTIGFARSPQRASSPRLPGNGKGRLLPADNGQAVSASLNGAKPGHGSIRWANLYIADSGNNRIRKVSAAGAISTYAGSGFARLFG